MTDLRTVLLATPPVPLVVDPRTFDAYAWAASRALEWRVPRGNLQINPLDGSLRTGVAFVFREPWDALPGELAWLHVGRAYGTGDAMCLAPYAIDDATDALFAHRRFAHETFWLAADNLNALYWALHDWSHFHNHGPFNDPTSTELQCDVAALAWLWINRETLPLTEAQWHAARESVGLTHARRCLAHPPHHALDAGWFTDVSRLISLAVSLH